MKRSKLTPAPVAPPAYDPKLVGYVRVSTREQNEDMQIFALTHAGVHPDHIHVDKGVSGRAKVKPARELALRELREGMTLVVWRLDRVSRSMVDMLAVLRDMEGRDVSLRSLTEYLDTRGAMGKLMIHILAAFAQFESDSGVERTTTGIRRAQARGVKFGQPTKITDSVIEKVNAGLAAGRAMPAIAKDLRLAESTLRKYWKGRVLDLARAGKKPRPAID